MQPYNQILAILPLSDTQIGQCYLTNHIEALVSEKEPDAPIGWNEVKSKIIHTFAKQRIFTDRLEYQRPI